MRTIAIAALVALAGCATNYQPSGFSGGFTEARLSENVVRVTFNGNGFTSPERVFNMAMLRSAQLTTQNGFQYFALADAQSSTAHSTIYTPVQSTTTATATSFGDTTTATGVTTSTGGQPIDIRKASTANLVVMFHESEGHPGMVYDAKFVCGSIGPKYKVTC